MRKQSKTQELEKEEKRRRITFFDRPYVFSLSLSLSLSLHVLSKGKKQRLVSVHCLFIYLIIGWVRLDLKPTQTQKRPDFLAWTQPEHPSNLPNTIRVVLG